MKRVLIAGAAAAVLVAIAGVGGYVYFFSNVRSSPSSLALSASPTDSPTASGGTSDLSGMWVVTSGSQARYRVKELFAGQTAKHDAVAQTSSVRGTITVSGDASGYQATAISVLADLTTLHSIDSVAGRDVTQRDGIVSRQLDVQQFPDAKFNATSASVPGTVTSSQVDVTVAGSLTIHGVTKPVTTTAKAQVTGGKIEIAGSMSINMTDYGVTAPQVPFTTVDSAATIEFDIFLSRA
ncbi:MAG TPA: YceI family protein [Candidatus Dormibacteraeota bacterium]|nr:YceI family protein [Candidatus Dormibacteraeota bacterium]